MRIAKMASLKLSENYMSVPTFPQGKSTWSSFRGQTGSIVILLNTSFCCCCCYSFVLRSILPKGKVIWLVKSQVSLFSPKESLAFPLISLYHFWQMFTFDTIWKHQKTVLSRYENSNIDQLWSNNIHLRILITRKKFIVRLLLLRIQ